MNNFGKRTISGFLFVAVLTTCIFIHPLCFFALFLVINVIGILEFANMLKTAQIHINRVMCAICGVVLFTAGFLHTYIGMQNAYVYALAVTFLLSICELYRKQTHSIHNLAFGIYALFYFTLPFTLLLYFPYMCCGKWQPDIVFYPFLLVWLNDTFAYLFGSRFGKHKLFPRISPKKSWEGAIGGGVTTIIAGTLLAPYIDGLGYAGIHPYLNAAAISTIVVFFGTFGDLIESMFKRCIEIKDSGNIMPGHGGMLDRFDSILFALPAIFVYLSLLQAE